MYETTISLKDNDIKLSMPLTKVDRDKRTVHGFATLDNLDKQDDIVTKEASIAAFENFKGNIREQHDPHKAVGKVVTFKEAPLYDPETDKTYEGVFVSAYVSKGAEDTWQKVLDGTLTGFSIGGSINDTEQAYDEDLDKAIRIVHQYDLLELSLVDSPANQLANVVSIEKTDSGVVVNTPLVKGDIENVFWCPEDNLVVVKSVDEEACAICDASMANVGFVESTDIDKKSKIKKSLDEFKKNSTVKEARNVAEDTIVEDKTETQEIPVQESAEVIEKSDETVEEVTEETTEKALDADSEVDTETKASNEADTEKVVEDAEVAKAADQIGALNESIASSLSTLADTVAALNDKIDGLAKSVTGVESQVSQVKGSTESLGKRVDAVEDTTAFQKSADLGEIEQVQEVRKGSPWGGRFLTSADL